MELNASPPMKSFSVCTSKSVAIGLIVLTSLIVGETVRADSLIAADDYVTTIQTMPVSISVLTNDTPTGSNQLAIIRVTAPAHGKVIINSGSVPENPELKSLFQFAGVQLSNSVVQIADTNQFPRSTIQTNGLWRTRSAVSWASGFFAGCLWLQYEQSGDPNFRTWAENWTGGIASQQYNTNTDDLGFMINCSFGNGYRLTTNEQFKAVVLQAAQSVATRFNSAVGGFGYLSDTNSEQYDLWLDSIMNMEMMFQVAAATGNTNLYNMAYSHAEKTMLNHVRTNNSTYHIVRYDRTTGVVLSRGTFAGAGDESTWARGHAWGTYGFTMAYRETRDLRFLSTAQKLADYFLANVPPDYVPYWDYQAPNIPNEPRDSSAAAITLSGIIELSQLVTNVLDSAKYWQAAHQIFNSLSSSNYLAQGSISSGILLHGVGETPPLWDQEIDVSLIYGDYYFIEALKRYRELYSHATLTYIPDPDFSGTDTFSYQAGDSGGESASATVTVVVQPGAPVLQISLAPASHFPIISFSTLVGRLYDVQYSDDLTGVGIWMSLSTNLTGSGTMRSVADTNPAPRRFYRVEVK
jgi:hypothetical protein